MSEKKIITVFCATGAQGGAVARALSKDPDLHVRAVTRDINCQKANGLKSLGVELVQCNTSNPASVREALSGADGCFVVTYTDFGKQNSYEMEMHEGRQIADACKAMRVGMVVFSTQRSSRVLGLNTRHMDVKAEIEQYMHDLDLPLTCVMVPCYYEQFMGLFKPEKIDNNKYILEIPMGTTPLHLIALDDVGEVVRQMFNNRRAFVDKTVGVCGDILTIRDIAATLTRVLTPKVFADKPLTVNDYRNQKDFPGVSDWANMFTFRMRVDQIFNINHTKMIHPQLKSFEEWARENSAGLHSVL